MTNLKQLALATAIASAPFAASAMEALDDEFLGDVTGQEGITIDRTYLNTIEEFQYVDGDGGGGFGAGKVKITDISIGQISGANLGAVSPGGFDASGNPASHLGSNFVLSQVTEEGQMIDATSNGVLITGARIGQEAYTGAGEMAAAAANGITLDASGNISIPTGSVDASGNPTFTTTAFTLFGNGKDINIGGIEFGNANSSMASIGSATILNASNYATSGRIITLVQRFGVAGGDFTAPTLDGQQARDLFANNANSWKQPETLISSKTDGTTGVVIESEGGMAAQALYYTDTDLTGGSVGVIGINQFRIVATNERSAAQDLSGTHIRGAYSRSEIDVEGGKLQIKNHTENSTVLGRIFVASHADLATAINQNGSGFSLGGVAILGNTWDGTTSIYAH